MTQPQILIENLHKRFQHQEVLKGVTFSAQKGDVIALMGSSGSGKSTLLRCINLLIRPDQGTMLINGEQFDFAQTKKISASKITALRTKVGIVFQQFNLWSHMTLMQNLIEAPVHVLKRDKKTAMTEAENMLSLVGLSQFLDRYPSQLSGGQQQRAAIARALMMKPEVMLFDEPTSALDPEAVGEVLQVMQQLAANGMTMIIATHELRFAQRVATHSIFLEAGKIIESGETNKIFLHPETERLKQFLTAMDMLGAVG